ncbi:hypothetical protein [Rhodanobacter sp. DHG33]|uniref:class I SAM-dependent methyltransferase n=1 Tax=Rhodanobacter sp. DHG33 TaxID=2775921 RepID=UPI001787519D|nr:hypothetical protein [Rhodanobacter sp. DHG33]MBD8899003.1 hypothetical protein [Rhodanobacter sp. DHG33]
MNIKAKIRKLEQLALGVLHEPGVAMTIPSFALHPKQSNWDVGMPWWNPRAIKYLKRNLPLSGNVFEWGSGGSTVWFSNRGLTVTAIESEREWADRVKGRCPTADVRFIPGMAVGEYRSEPQLRDKGQHFFDDYIAAIDEFPDDSLDIVVVDGICRVECARRAAKKVKPDGFVIVDDTNWKFLLPRPETFKGWKCLTFSGLKSNSGLEIFSTTFFRRPK